MEAASRRNHGEESWRLHHGGVIIEEASLKRQPGGRAVRRRQPGGTRRHPGGARRHPGGSQEAPRRHQEAPRGQPRGTQICICVCICFNSVTFTTCFEGPRRLRTAGQRLRNPR